MKIIRAYFYLFIYFGKLFLNLLYGIWQLAKLQYAPVTILGGSKLDKDNIYRHKANDLVHLLFKHNIPVLAGGSSMLIEKESCVKDIHTIETVMWIPVKKNKKAKNTCDNNGSKIHGHKHIEIKHFFSRKWLLTSYSKGFVIFPGGFGTLSELTEILTLIQTKIRKKVPIILFGSSYWNPFFQWIKESQLKNNLISKEDLELLMVTDDLDYIVSNFLKIYERELVL